MRHVYIRGILALIWLAAAAVSGLSGNLEWAGLYVLMGAAFGYSAWASWKKEKNDKRGELTMGGNILELQNLSAWYSKGKNVLSGFSLQLRPHEVVGLIGLNGAGKTTFLKTLSGLHEGFRCGSIYLNGQAASFRDKGFKLRRYTVFAEDNSFQYFTFREYLAYASAAYKTKLPDVTELVRGFHFEDYTDTLLKDLSTGNKKKAFLITAFALKRPLLLLDEPVNGLDFQSTEYLYQLIAGYKEHGTVLFSSHILESITLTSDRVLVLEEGQIRRSFAGGEINAANIREALHDENEL